MDSKMSAADQYETLYRGMLAEQKAADAGEMACEEDVAPETRASRVSRAAVFLSAALDNLAYRVYGSRRLPREFEALS